MKKLLLLLGLLANLALAAPIPEEMVRNTSKDVVDILKKEKNDRKAREQVQARVLPSFDFGRMTALAVGRHWRGASPDQRTQLTDEFRQLLVRTYSSALTTYKAQAVDVKPLKIDDAATDVTVLTEVAVANQQPVSINYSLRKTEQGWKVYDVIVAGVSLVTNYRGTFNETVQASGLDGLVKLLKEKNQSGGALKTDKS
ncbi:MAG: ABC transporter substrate-binding protein [Chitinivorax sp.]